MLLPLLWRRCGERRSMTLSPRRGRSAIATVIEEPPSPFLDPEARPVDPGKFRDPLVTAKDEPRAHVGLEARKSVVTGKRVSVRVILGGRGIIKKTNIAVDQQ